MKRRQVNSGIRAAMMLLALCPVLMQAQPVAIPKTITVKGSVQFLEPNGDNKIRLYKEQMTGDPKVIDSAVVSEDNKSFHFTLKQDHPGIYKVVAYKWWDQVSFWSDANVNIDMRGYDTVVPHIKIPHYTYVEGSMDNNYINLYEQIEQLSYLRMVDEYNEEYYANEHKSTDSAWNHYLKTKMRYDSLSKDLHLRSDVLFRAFIDRPVTLYSLRTMTDAESSSKFDYALEKLDKLIAKYPWLSEAKEAKQRILTNREMARKVKPGKPLPSISYPDGSGQLQGLEKYKGKYLLVDFWASWCGPCRQAIPKIKELYAAQHPNGFEVVSISIDKDKNAWRKAMGEENMPWEQLLSPDNDETMKIFQFGGVPTFYVVDPNGKIIRTFSGYGPDSETDIQNILKNKTMAPAEGGQVMKAMSM
jgi:thiol-disulfide isomerase/thioredoxin